MAKSIKKTKKKKWNPRSAEFCLELDKRLRQHFGKADPPLKFKTTEQLAVAVILSAQCTDERVNMVTPKLFEKYPDMFALAKAKVSDIEKIIYSTGFYKNKARNIHKLANILVEKYQGKIPKDFDTLIKLPGIGRKTANVIMAVAFHEAPGIVVDTHVARITRLLGMTDKKTPQQIEKDLMTFMPKELWRELPLYLIFLGRKFCIARRPKCNECILQDMCAYAIGCQR